jgi:hypothetical protein
MARHSDLVKLGEVLQNQSQEFVRSGDYDDVREFTLEHGTEHPDHLIVKVDAVKVGFVFNVTHQLIGIFNWKD